MSICLARLNLSDSLKNPLSWMNHFYLHLLTFHSYVARVKGWDGHWCFYFFTPCSKKMRSIHCARSPLEWKFFELDKVHLQAVLARVEFPCRCGEKRHHTLRECHRRNTLTGSGGSCCRSTLLGRSMRPFSVPLSSLFGLGHLTWCQGGWQGVEGLLGRGLVTALH